MGFRITDTVETRTDTEIVVVLTLAPEGCVRIQTGTGVADISLDINMSVRKSPTIYEIMYRQTFYGR